MAIVKRAAARRRERYTFGAVLLFLMSYCNYCMITLPDVNEKKQGADVTLVAEPNTCLEVGTSRKRYRPSPGQQECLLYEEPSLYFSLLADTLVGLPNAGRCDFSHDACAPPHAPYLEDQRKFGKDWPPYGFTMIGKARLDNFRAAILDVNRNHIPGAIAEFGVWRGGAMMMAAAIQKHSSPTIPRELYLFDAFASFNGYGKHEAFLAVSLEKVKSGFQQLGLDDASNMHYVKGLFNETVVEWADRKDPIAVLRADGNFYASYQDVMYAMYENVAVGGIVIFDDVFHPHYKEVLKFWETFKEDHGLPEEMLKIDDFSGWFRKQKEVTVDQGKKKQVPLQST